MSCLSNHAYVRKIAPDKAICLDCGRFLDLKAKNENKGPLIMPPLLYDFDKYTWPMWNPWPNISLKLAEKYGWYGSVIGMDDYLVMPIFRRKLPVGYSARRITNNGGKKYRLPKDRAKYIWQSSDSLRLPVLVGEGVADAVWLSQLGSSVALLGSYGEIPELPIITVMDGDEKGIEAAFRIVQEQKKKGIVGAQAVILPGGDPTDYTLKELSKIITDQTGVRL